MAKRSVRFSTQVLLMQLGLLIVVCGAGLVFSRLFVRHELIAQYEQRALGIARSVAADVRYPQALARRDPAGEIQQWAEAVRRRTGADFVVVTDREGIRYSHPDRALLHRPVARDQEQALHGAEVVTFGPDAAGQSARGKVPIRDADGHVVGEVIVAIDADEVDARTARLERGAAVFVLGALAVGTAAAMAFTRRTRRQTHGLAPVALQRLLEEQAALRRVATLVAAGGSSSAVFAAVAGEVRDHLHADTTLIARLDADGSGTVVGRAGDDPDATAVGSRLPSGWPPVLARVIATGRPARGDDDERGGVTAVAPVARFRSSVGAPIIVDGRLWGVIGVAARDQHFPAATEERIADFTELIAMAIANAESGAELAASRARVVNAGDETRRRIERDLHDGTQQRLVALALELRAAEAKVPSGQPELTAQLSRVAASVAEVVEELQEISRGIHPVILSRGGLVPALRALARRAAVPVELDLTADGRLPEPVEVAAYYVVSEALTNAAKHADANVVRVALDTDGTSVHLAISDDGTGGADTGKGSGLIGLRDRVEALGGRLELTSPTGGGTTLDVTIPTRPR